MMSQFPKKTEAQKPGKPEIAGTLGYGMGQTWTPPHTCHGSPRWRVPLKDVTPRPLAKHACPVLVHATCMECLVTWAVGGWATPLKHMSSSIGMMTFPTEWENKIHVPVTTNQAISTGPWLP